MAEFFIALGADVNALDLQRRTPLAVSAERFHISTVTPTARVLVLAGADIHHPMQGDLSPARIGILRNLDYLAALINPGSLESTDSNGRTVLHIASEYGNAGAVQKILGAGRVNLARRDNQGKTALDISLERTDSRDHAEAAEYLILAGAISSLPLYTYYAPAVRTANYNIRSADGMAPLHYMAREGFLGYIIYSLERGADINIKNAAGTTPLHEAVRSGNLMVTEALLELGADVGSQDAKGNTVLHMVPPPQFHFEMCELLLSWGADPNAKDEHGDAPLHIVMILNRSPELVRLLLENGADVSVRNVEGKTPLYLAVEAERAGLIPVLLYWNSDIFAADNYGFTPFEVALIDSPSVLHLLITDETVHQTDSHGNTMLHITIRRRGNPNVVNFILSRDINVNTRNYEGETALHIAVRLNEETSGTLLLNRGADIFAPNARGETPLFLTFPQNGNVAEVRIWMLTPRTLSARDGLGNTALHHAAQWQFDRWIYLMVQLGANTEAVNATGEPPLFIAAKHNSPSTVRALVLSDARIDSRDRLGNTALHAAVHWNARNSAEALINLGLDIDSHAFNGKTALHDSISLGVVEIEILLLSHGANVEARDTNGNTPFMEAVMAGYPQSMRRLVDRGADFNTRNFRGDTPLHMAAAMQRIDTATLLLAWGASIHARNSIERTPFQNALGASPYIARTLLAGDRILRTDDYGSSPLHIAIHERVPQETFITILNMGARISSLDSDGKTPLRLAIDTDQWDLATILANAGSDIFLRARDGITPADAAMAKSSPAINAVFSENGPAINARDNAGNTILHYAAQLGDIDVIRELIGLGANISILNFASESPAEIALRWRHPEAASMLR
jgi:hypothetical protein